MIQLPKLSTSQVDKVNIGLMIISLILAFVLPFEVFLFSYAVLGPLHYLTEISWLHQKNYFVPKVKKLSLWIFPIIAAVLTFVLVYDDVVELLRKTQGLPPVKEKVFAHIWNTNLIFFLFGLACVLVLVQKTWMKVAGIAILTIFALSFNIGKTYVKCTNPQTKAVQTFYEDNDKKERSFVQKNGFDTDGDGFIDNCETVSSYRTATMIITAYLPTLIHVYIFTMLFMLFGALKSGSKIGLVSVVVLIICGALPFLWDPPFLHYVVSAGAKKSYDASFYDLNTIVLRDFKAMAATPENVYGSHFGIMLTRFIAFAYTYHYLNWFSKTSIIQWHKMPVLNLGLVLVLWVAAVVLYYVDYRTGLTALLFLSFLHVFLEFPLNFHSFVGIVRSLFKGKKAAAA
jgi:hypothetical protein